MRKNNLLSSKKCLVTAMIVLATGALAACGSEKKQYTWPDTEIASRIPEPDEEEGEVVLDQDASFIINVNDTDEDEYSKYIDACQKSGFTEDVSCSDDVFIAEDSDGYFLSIFYIADSEQMQITISAPVDESSAAAEASLKNSQLAEAGISAAETSEEANTSETTDASDSDDSAAGSSDQADVRTTLDDYEKNIDEYTSFMKDYIEEGYPEDKKDEYMTYLSSLSESMNKISALDQRYSEMSDDDKAYYDEVMARVEDKLREIEK